MTQRCRPWGLLIAAMSAVACEAANDADPPSLDALLADAGVGGKQDDPERIRLFPADDGRFVLLVADGQPIAQGGTETPPTVSSAELDLPERLVVRDVVALYFAQDVQTAMLSIAIDLPDGERVTLLSNAGQFGPQANPELSSVERIALPEAEGQRLRGPWSLLVRADASVFDPHLVSWGLEFALAE